MLFGFTVLLGKSVRALARLRGGGSALPGLFVEKIDRQFVAKSLSKFPCGVVIISGTNGKTTTTKIAVELLECQGLKVFTNRTGSNFSRGVAAALLADMDLRGRVQADIAVLELDEAHGANFVQDIKPTYSLILNVMRDQLDRFGEIDTTAQLLEKIVASTAKNVVLNRHDPRIVKLAKSAKAKVSYFGLNKNLLKEFPADDEMYKTTKNSTRLPKADVTLESLNKKTIFSLGGKNFETTLQLSGIYNLYNATAALALVKTIMGGRLKTKPLIAALAKVTPAFGRGEVVHIGGHPLELVLVKNPSGFRLALRSFSGDNYKTMIAINDNFADGRDMSWLWDVDFTSLPSVSMVSGLRADDMALRLYYDEVEYLNIESNLAQGLRKFIANNSRAPKRIYCTYTAMLAIRKELAKITKIEAVI